MRNFLDMAVDFYLRNRRVFFFMLILYGAGALLGGFLPSFLGDVAREDFREFAMEILAFIPAAPMNSFECFLQLFCDNIVWIVVFYLLGFFAIATPFIGAIIIYRGVTLGFTLALLFGADGAIAGVISFMTVLPQQLLIVPVLLFAATLAISFSLQLASGKNIWGSRLIYFSIANLALVAILVFASFIGGFVGTKLLSLFFSLL